MTIATSLIILSGTTRVKWRKSFTELINDITNEMNIERERARYMSLSFISELIFTETNVLSVGNGIVVVAVVIVVGSDDIIVWIAAAVLLCSLSLSSSELSLYIVLRDKFVIAVWNEKGADEELP